MEKKTICVGAACVRGSLRLVLAAALLSPLAASGAGQVLQADFGNQGLSSLRYGGMECLVQDDAAPQVAQIEFREYHAPPPPEAEQKKDWWEAPQEPTGPRHAGDLSKPERRFDSATRSRTVAYPWGSLTCSYEVTGNRLDLRVKITNSTAAEIDGIDLRLLKIRLAGKPPGQTDNDAVMGFLRLDLGSGAYAALCNWEVDRPVAVAIKPDPEQPGVHTISLSVEKETVPHHPVVHDMYFHRLGRQIAPGKSDEYRVSLCFAGNDTPEQESCRTFLDHVRSARPMKLKWDDRRPIGRIFLCNSFTQWPTNPRGYLFGKRDKNNVFTEEGLKQFRADLLAHADQCIKILKKYDAQGVIIWDLEGAEYWHPMTYIGNPHQMSFVSPEMEKCADEYLKKFTAAGLKVGLTLRPTEITLGTVKYTRFWHRYPVDPVEHLYQKIKYCKDRWDCRIFYLDSNSYGSYDPWHVGVTDKRLPWVMPTRMIRELQERVPDVLIIPEHETDLYHAYVPTYKTSIIDEYGASPRAQTVWPDAFSVVTFDDRRGEEMWDRYVAGRVKGDVHFLEGWYEPAASTYTTLMYREATYLKAGAPETLAKADLPRLLELAKTPDGCTRYHTAVALAGRAQPEALAALTQLLKDDDPVVRKAAVVALAPKAAAAAEETVAAVLAVLEDKDRTLGFLKTFAARAAGAFGDRVLPRLATMIAAKNDLSLPYAVQAVGWTRSQDKQALAALAPLLAKDFGNGYAKKFACQAAGRLGQPEAVPLLIGCLQDADEDAAEAAIVALGELADRRAVTPLIALFDRKFASWTRTRIPGALNEALRKITGVRAEGKAAWQAVTQAAATEPKP